MTRGRLVAVLIPYVLCTALHALALKQLARMGVSAADTLVWRGLVCVALAAAFAAYHRASLWPNRPGLQAARAASAGLSLWLLTAAYQYANATTVSAISRLDTAILIMLGPLAAVAASNLQRGLAALSFLVLAFLALAQGSGESVLGYGLAFAGTLGVTAGYLFLRSSAKSENPYVIAGVAGAAIVVYGLAAQAFGPPSVAFEPLAWGLLAASGMMMYALYQLTIALYKVMDVALAEYPTLFAALLVLPAEALVFGVQFSAVYVAAMVANVALLGGILALAPRPAASTVPVASGAAPDASGGSDASDPPQSDSAQGDPPQSDPPPGDAPSRASTPV